ncbi:MAG: RNA methyltransferase [Microlunatus sp.]|nr:RNA methyltransferase [Microlunatus sp.]
MAAGLSELRQVGAAHPDVRRALLAGRGAEPGHLLISGLWAHHAVLDAGVGVDAFFCTPELLYSDEGRQLARVVAARSEVAYRVSAKTIGRLSDRHRSLDGMASVITLPQWRPDRLDLPTDPLIVVADGLESPGNLGTVIRTMDACRADLLIMTGVRTPATGPAVFKGSRGRTLTMPQIEFESPSEAVDWLTARSVAIRVADADGSQAYTAADWSGATAIVLGNEHAGPSDAWRDFPQVRIPMLGRADSLNVAVSAGVLLFHARAQRDGWPSRTG